MYVSFFLKCRVLSPTGECKELEQSFHGVNVPLDVNISDVDEPSNVAAHDFVLGC
jgi:hypothetical protein